MLEFVKKLFKSKTFWFHVLFILVYVANQFGFGDFQPDAQLLVLIQAVVGIILRIITKKPIAEKESLFE